MVGSSSTQEFKASLNYVVRSYLKKKMVAQ